jgi:hypothetical protein
MMFGTVLNIFKNASAFLQNGVSPPNTSIENKKIMEDENHFASKKLFIVFTSLIALLFFYFSNVIVLFFLQHSPEVITSFVTMFSKCMEILSVIIASYLGCQAIVDLRYNSSSSASVQGNFETIKQTIEKKYIIDCDDANSPKIKPFSAIAID